MSFPEHIPSEMSKVGYTEVSLGETLQYEHRIKVNDFVRVLEQKGEIKTSPLKVFPGLELEFVIRKMAETCMVNNIQYLYSNATIIACEIDHWKCTYVEYS